MSSAKGPFSAVGLGDVTRQQVQRGSKEGPRPCGVSGQGGDRRARRAPGEMAWDQEAMRWRGLKQEQASQGFLLLTRQGSEDSA